MFLRRVRPFLLVIAWVLTCGLAFLYLKTAYQSSRTLQIVCALEFIAAFGLSLANTRWRFVLVGLAVVSLPRLPSLVAQAPLHNLLFPLFLGMSFGRLFISIRTSMRTTPTQGTPPHAGYFTLGLIVLLLLASANSVLQYSEIHEILLNRIIGPGMTSHYAIFLSTTLALNLLAPLIWIATERSVSAPGDGGGASSVQYATRSLSSLDPVVVAKSVSFGVTLGAIVFIIAALLQNSFDFVNAGIADRALEAGRRPGLFSDSGASGVMVCAILMLMCVNVLADRQAFRMKPILLALPFLFLTGFLIPFQGRVIWLALSGVLIVLPFCFKQLHLSPRPLIVSLFVLASMMIGALFLEKYRMLGVDLLIQAMQRVDPARPVLLEWGLDIFWKSPLFGHGLNSFIPQLAELETRIPEVYPENSPGLVPGLLNDVGIVGLVIVVLLLGRYLRLLSQTMSTVSFGDIHVRALVFLPMSLAPTFLIGYHLLHPEVAAFVLFPLLVVPPSR